VTTTRTFNWERARQSLAMAQVEGSFEFDLQQSAAVLDRRTAALASRNNERLAEGRGLMALIVRSRDERYALPLAAVVGVVRRRRLGALPVSGDALAGTLHERGEVWLVYRLSALLGLPSRGDSEEKVVILARHPSRRIAFCEDALDGFESLAHDAFSQPADTFHRDPTFIRGIADDGLMLIDDAALWRHPAIIQGAATCI